MDAIKSRNICLDCLTFDSRHNGVSLLDIFFFFYSICIIKGMQYSKSESTCLRLEQVRHSESLWTPVNLEIFVSVVLHLIQDTMQLVCWKIFTVYVT